MPPTASPMFRVRTERTCRRWRFGVTPGTVGSGLAGAYGTLTLNANGSYSYVLNNANPTVQALSPGQTLTEVFTYTLLDNDGDSDTATLTITINGSNDVPTVTVPQAGAPGTSVEEAGLPARPGEPAGSNAAANSETTSGTITFTNGDGASTVTINGVTVAVNATVVGDYGTLTVTAFNAAAGTISYSYTLADNVDHDSDPSPFESFTVNVADSDGNPADDASATFQIQIVDDVPTANDDDARSVAEDGPNISGNVINPTLGDDPNQSGLDVQGADGATLTHVNIGSGFVLLTSGTPLGGGVFQFSNSVGVYTFTAAGAWTFNPNNNLNNASGIDASFSYRLTDNDGDTDEATQPITVTDGAGPAATKNATITVDEEGLGTANATGTNPAATSETSNDTVTFQAGSDAITSVVFGSTAGITVDVNGVPGADIVWSANGANQIIGTIGGITAITINLTPPALPIAAGGSGSATVTVILSDNFPHPNANGQNTIILTGVTVVATDTDGDTATATATINVIDDVPIVADPAPVDVVNEPGESASAALDADLNIANNFGADGGKVIFTQASIDALVAEDLELGGQDIEYAISADGQTLTATRADNDSVVFTIVLQPAGSPNNYTVNIVQQLDALITIEFNDVNFDFVGGNSSWAGFIPTTEDENSPPIDNDSQDLLLTPEVNGANASTINTSANTGGVGSGQSVGAGPETFRIDFVTDLRGDPADSVGGSDYDALGNRDHVFDGHYTVEGASAIFTATTGSTINIAAYDDVDGNNVVGDDPTPDTISSMIITYNGVASALIDPTTTSTNYTVNGMVYTVTLLANGSVNVASDVLNNNMAAQDETSILVFTEFGVQQRRIYLGGRRHLQDRRLCCCRPVGGSRSVQPSGDDHRRRWRHGFRRDAGHQCRLRLCGHGHVARSVRRRVHQQRQSAQADRAA